MKKTMLFVAAALALVTTPVLAWTISVPYWSYTAPFVCAFPDDDTFSTSVTVHNPHAQAVEFGKWIEITELEGAVTPPEPVALSGVLQPNTSDKVNCAFIRKALGLSAHANVMGDVVFQSGLAHPNGAAKLDVSARYLVRIPHRSASYSVIIIPGVYIEF